MTAVSDRRTAPHLATVAAILVGALLRATFLMWADPWTPHHPDEHILPLEAMALWEGITPREIGWPASTSRLLLSATLGTELVAERGAALWQQRQSPEAALHLIAQWTGAQYADPTRLYRTGRVISAIVGIGQLAVLAWALGQWAGPAGTAVGTLAVAIAPTPVLYSQYVLADIAALLFATVVVGLAARPTDGRILAMGAFAGLAASSKFHFGIWLFTPLIAAFLTARSRRWTLCAGTLALAGCVVVALVPWFWLNPPLAAKEFLGVVGPKVNGGSDLARMARNAAVLIAGIGVLLVVGIAAAAILRDRRPSKPILAVALPAALAAAVMVMGRVVFDRYALVLVPGGAVLAAIGWDRWLGSSVHRLKRMGEAALVVCLVGSLIAIWTAERSAAETDVDVLVKRWVLEHVPAGRRVAVHDEMNAMLPRTPAELRQCATFIDTPAAYRLKWAVEGDNALPFDDEPMRAMLLNDEQFAAYWCRRELETRSGKAFEVVKYHDEPRFGAVPEREAIREFATGERTATGGIDVLVMNREVDVNVPVAVTFVTARGRRVIYEK